MKEILQSNKSDTPHWWTQSKDILDSDVFYKYYKKERNQIYHKINQLFCQGLRENDSENTNEMNSFNSRELAVDKLNEKFCFFLLFGFFSPSLIFGVVFVKISINYKSN